MVEGCLFREAAPMVKAAVAIPQNNAMTNQNSFDVRMRAFP
jgi:hypothetical protein